MWQLPLFWNCFHLPYYVFVRNAHIQMAPFLFGTIVCLFSTPWYSSMWKLLPQNGPDHMELFLIFPLSLSLMRPNSLLPPPPQEYIHRLKEFGGTWFGFCFVFERQVTKCYTMCLLIFVCLFKAGDTFSSLDDLIWLPPVCWFISQLSLRSMKECEVRLISVGCIQLASAPIGNHRSKVVQPLW